MVTTLQETLYQQPPEERLGRLSGMTLAVGVRNSGAAQVGNWRSMEQEHALVQKIERLGGKALLFDEQGTSGRDMSKRPVLLDILEMVERGEVQGMAYYDIKRLSRNEFGIDGGIIAKRLVEAGAVLVTGERIYELWQDDHMLDYDFQKLMSAHDIRGIRKTFWSGVFARAESEPFFMGIAPTGYRTEIVQTDTSTGTRIRRLPAKNPDEAEIMGELTRLLGACYSLGDVARELNARDLKPSSRRQPSRGCPYPKGSPVPWNPDRIRTMLFRPIYWGEPEMGSTVSKKSAVWRLSQGRNLLHLRPDLAYWTKAQVYRWREKFSSIATKRGGRPMARTRKHDYPLRGVLACASCSHPLVGAGLTRIGDTRYWCPVRSDRAACAHPQSICQRAALRALRALLPEITQVTGAALTSLGSQTQAQQAGVDELRRELRVKREQIDGANQAWLASPNKPQSTLKLIEGMEAEFKGLEERVVLAEQDLLDTRGAAENAEMCMYDPEQLAHVIDQADPGLAGAFYRGMVSGVRVRTLGHGRYARSEVMGYTPLVAGTSGGTTAQLLSAFRSLLAGGGKTDALIGG